MRERTIAEMIDDLFSLHARKLGLDGGAPELSTAKLPQDGKRPDDLFEHERSFISCSLLPTSRTTLKHLPGGAPPLFSLCISRYI